VTLKAVSASKPPYPLLLQKEATYKGERDGRKESEREMGGRRVRREEMKKREGERERGSRRGNW
jgi:hypothetical protein